MSAMLKQKLIDIATGFTKYGLWKGGTEITVDSKLSTTSMNPVQNKVITAALNGKQDKIIIDSELSTTSTNPVQNKVVTGAINAIESDLLKCHINGNSNIEILYYKWSGNLVAGHTVLIGSFEEYIPSGKAIIGMFFTPLANLHVTMSYLGYNVYAYSEVYSGSFYYDVLMIVS